MLNRIVFLCQFCRTLTQTHRGFDLLSWNLEIAFEFSFTGTNVVSVFIYKLWISKPKHEQYTSIFALRWWNFQFSHSHNFKWNWFETWSGYVRGSILNSYYFYVCVIFFLFGRIIWWWKDRQTNSIVPISIRTEKKPIQIRSDMSIRIIST